LVLFRVALLPTKNLEAAIYPSALDPAMAGTFLAVDGLEFKTHNSAIAECRHYEISLNNLNAAGGYDLDTEADVNIRAIC
jgi:hypothetical protein